MTRDFLAALTRRFYAYLDGFRLPDGSLQEMLQLKLDHTASVVKNVRLIMAGEGWPEGTRVLGEACALLHDVGRFSQLRDFGTFQDSKSIDHAARSVEVVEGGRWLEGLAAEERRRVLTAVALHNKKEVAPSLEAATADLCHLVRDADKLDIFRVLEVAATDGSLSRNPEIAWELQVKGAPSPEVVAAVSRGQPVCYTWIKTLSDFVLIQVGWLQGGLRYRTSLRLARERRALEFREAYLRTLSDAPGVAVCCEAARAYMARQLDGAASG
jgi:hypothetical protein